MYSERDIPEMSLSLDCLILGKTSFEKIFHVTVADTIISDNTKVPINKAKVGQFKSHIWSTKRNKFSIDDPDGMNLWKVNIDEESKLVGVSTEDDIKEKLEGTKMLPQKLLRRYFPEEPSADSSENVHIIITVPTTTIELKRKKPITKEEESKKEVKTRKFTTNGAITKREQSMVYFVDPIVQSSTLLQMIREGGFVAFYGSRASGKSTRVISIMDLLKTEFICIRVTLKFVNIETVEDFWSAFGIALYLDGSQYFNESTISSASDFLLAFRNNKWEKPVILFIDEYDKLYRANDAVRTSFLETLRGIKNMKDQFAIWSAVLIGTFSILHLRSTPPFNVIKESYCNPYFTLEQVKLLYKEFENEYRMTIDSEVIEDIYMWTNGHAGLVCICGKAIHNSLIDKLNKERKLSFTVWLNYKTDKMLNKITSYETFRTMVLTFTTDDDDYCKIKSSLNFLRLMFIGFFGFVKVIDFEEIKLAEFLTAEGVLLKDIVDDNKFKMSSFFIDELMRQRVIPEVYKDAPTVAVPRKGHFLDILEILQMAIQFFDKDIISNAFDRSFKIAHDLYVGGLKNKLVPRESIYETELNRILVNWLVKEGGFEVTGQWHLVYEDKHTYSNIVITTDCQKIVLKLLATATKKELNEHFERVLKYAEQLSVDDIWIVHFTCEDGYATQKLQWPSDNRINVVHFFHDQTFNVLMNARYADSAGTIEYIVDQAVPLQS